MSAPAIVSKAVSTTVSKTTHPIAGIRLACYPYPR
jgi:hypothetical protein